MEGNFVLVTFKAKQTPNEHARFLGGHSELEHTITQSRHFETGDRAAMVACRIRPTEDSVSLNLQRPNAATRRKESEREDTGFPKVALISS
jgi:hypothetical protein